MRKSLYRETRDDFEYIANHCGSEYPSDPTDFCGDVCNTELFFDLLENPTKQKATEMYAIFIKRYFSTGNEDGNLPDMKDERVREIKERYLT